MKNIALLLILFGMSCTTVVAQLNYQEDLFSPDTVMKYRSKIELSDLQVKQIEDISDAHYNEFRKTKWNLEEAQQKLNESLAQSKVDKTAALAQMEAVTSIENQLKKMRLQMLIEVKNTLEVDQQNALRKLRTDVDIKNLNIVTSLNNSQNIKLELGKNLKGSDEPLYIIMGKDSNLEVSKLDMKSLDPNNIESLTVLKGKSAKTKYGDKGKNGVIEIVIKNK